MVMASPGLFVRLSCAASIGFLCVLVMEGTKGSRHSRTDYLGICTDDMTSEQCFYTYLSVYAQARARARKQGTEERRHSQTDYLGICTDTMTSDQCFYAYLTVYVRARARARELGHRVYLGPVRPHD